MADRFFAPDAPHEGRLSLGPEEARHLARVRRVGVGAIVEVFDGRGSGYRAEVLSVHRDRVDLAVVEEVPDRAAPRSLTVATAVPKGDRFDWLVEKATELGVARLVPLVTERSTVDPRDAKLGRLRRSIVEASKQCGRNRLMKLDEPIHWDDFLAGGADEGGLSTRLVAHPGGQPIASIARAGNRPVVLAIGPEGGFTGAEIAAARDRGWEVVGLGATLLRIETAALAGAAILIATGAEV